MIGIMTKPLPEVEKEYVLQMLAINVELICTGNDPEEIEDHLSYAYDRLRQLADSRILELRERRIF